MTTMQHIGKSLLFSIGQFLWLFWSLDGGGQKEPRPSAGFSGQASAEGQIL